MYWSARSGIQLMMVALNTPRMRITRGFFIRPSQRILGNCRFWMISLVRHAFLPAASREAALWHPAVLATALKFVLCSHENASYHSPCRTSYRISYRETPSISIHAEAHQSLHNQEHSQSTTSPSPTVKSTPTTSLPPIQTASPLPSHTSLFRPSHVPSS